MHILKKWLISEILSGRQLHEKGTRMLSEGAKGANLQEGCAWRNAPEKIWENLQN